jgi:hypothetical protein
VDLEEQLHVPAVFTLSVLLLFSPLRPKGYGIRLFGEENLLDPSRSRNTAA